VVTGRPAPGPAPEGSGLLARLMAVVRPEFRVDILVPGPGALMGDLVSPEEGLTIAFLQGGEVAAGPEGFAYVTNGAFDAAFLIAGPHLAGTGDAVIVGTQLQQTGMEVDLIAAPLQHRTAKIVMKNHAR